MAARKSTVLDHQGDAPTTEFAFLLSCAEPETIAKIRTYFSADQDRLELLIRRAVNRIEHLNNEDEATLRGKIGRHKIGELKAAGKLPEEPS